MRLVLAHHADEFTAMFGWRRRTMERWDAWAETFGRRVGL
jgi:hypothetical protein